MTRFDIETGSNGIRVEVGHNPVGVAIGGTLVTREAGQPWALSRNGVAVDLESFRASLIGPVLGENRQNGLAKVFGY